MCLNAYTYAYSVTHFIDIRQMVGPHTADHDPGYYRLWRYLLLLEVSDCHDTAMIFTRTALEWSPRSVGMRQCYQHQLTEYTIGGGMMDPRS